MSGAACPDGTGLEEAGVGAGLSDRACRAPGAPAAAGDRGRNRYAPSPASTRTTTTKAANRWTAESSMPISYFRRQIGRLQNGVAGGSSSDLGCRPYGAPEAPPPDPLGPGRSAEPLAGRRGGLPPRRVPSWRPGQLGPDRLHGRAGRSAPVARSLRGCCGGNLSAGARRRGGAAPSGRGAAASGRPAAAPCRDPPLHGAPPQPDLDELPEPPGAGGGADRLGAWPRALHDGGTPGLPGPAGPGCRAGAPA